MSMLSHVNVVLTQYLHWPETTLLRPRAVAAMTSTSRRTSTFFVFGQMITIRELFQLRSLSCPFIVWVQS